MKLVYVVLFLFLSLIALPATAADDEPVEPYPLEYFALRDVISNVLISPDGKRLALMTIPTRDGNPIIEVYDASNLEAEPFRLNADPMEITSFYWVSNTNIVFTLRQKVRDRIKGFNQGVYDTRLALLDVESEKIETFDELNATISHLLPNEPDKIILSFNPGSEESSKIAEAFRPRAYYEFRPQARQQETADPR
ncbi:MAG: hypothetical protein U5K38_00280 [Woeseiaceae bacterium]|nr:hypothetical protein [Woeseiaceae bacterium]